MAHGYAGSLPSAGLIRDAWNIRLIPHYGLAVFFLLAHLSSGFTFRFDYGSAVPWVSQLPGEDGIAAIAGPNLVALQTPVKLKGEDLSTSADFTISSGERIPFVLTYGPSHRPPPAAMDADLALNDTAVFWREWSSHCTYYGHRREAVLRSLLTLKVLTFAETGGIVAAPTTSLPEQIGASRNWDYRYCWVRDATLTLIALMGAGYYDEAAAWRHWLQRAVAGSPDDLQIMYGLSGERRLGESSIPVPLPQPVASNVLGDGGSHFVASGSPPDRR